MLPNLGRILNEKQLYPADGCSILKPQFPVSICVIFKVCFWPRVFECLFWVGDFESYHAYWEMGLSCFKPEAYFSTAVGLNKKCVQKVTFWNIS